MSSVCSDCGAVFARSEHLQRHKLRHLGARPFKCEECGSVFSRKYGKEKLHQFLSEEPGANSMIFILGLPSETLFVAMSCPMIHHRLSVGGMPMYPRLALIVQSRNSDAMVICHVQDVW